MSHRVGCLPSGSQSERCLSVADLFHEPPRGRDTDPEPNRELGERLTFPQVRQDQKRLLPHSSASASATRSRPGDGG